MPCHMNHREHAQFSNTVKTQFYIEGWFFKILLHAMVQTELLFFQINTASREKLHNTTVACSGFKIKCSIVLLWSYVLSGHSWSRAMITNASSAPLDAGTSTASANWISREPDLKPDEQKELKNGVFMLFPRVFGYAEFLTKILL